MWHAQPTRLTMRFIRPPGTPQDHSEPDAVAQVDLRTDGTAFIHAAKSHPALSVKDWRGLVRVLRRDWGVVRIQADRHGLEFTVPTERVELSTKTVDKAGTEAL